MNLRKRFFLLLMSLFFILGLTACNSADTTVKISLDKDEYTVRAGEKVTTDVNVTTGSKYTESEIRKGLVYSSSDESVAKFVNGELIGVGYGETEIKVEWSEKAIVFDRAKVVVGLETLPEIVYADGFKTKMYKTTEQKLDYKLSFTSSHVNVSWKALNPEIASLSEGEEPTITALAVGTARFVATITDGVFTEERELTIVVESNTYTINYVLDGGTNSELNPSGYDVLNLPLALTEAVKENYTFVGWYKEAAFVNKVTEIEAGTTGDITLYAKFEAVKFNITYDLAGGLNDKNNPQQYTVEDEFTLSPATKEGYTFDGWYNGEEKVEKIEKGTAGDLTLTAKYSLVKYNITYDFAGGAFDIYRYQTREEMASAFLADFNKFAGTEYTNVASFWADSTNRSNFFKDEKMHAKYLWMLQEIRALCAKQGIDCQYIDGVIAGTSTISYALQNVAIYLLGINNKIWNEQYKETYGGLASKWTTIDATKAGLPLKDGAVVPSYTYTIESEFDLATPTLKGYKFVGWYNGEEKVEKIVKGLTGDITLTAKWEVATYNVTYVLNDGVLPEGVTLVTTYKMGESFTLPTLTKEATRYASYTFLGWGLTEDATEFVTGVSETDAGDLTFYAIFEETEIEVVSKINYVLNEGVLPEGAKTEYTERQEFVLPVPTRKGYRFLGWTLTEGGTEYVTVISSESQGDVTVYANWEELTNEYKITYVLNGGSWTKNIPGEVTYEGEALTSIATSANSGFWTNYKEHYFLFNKETFGTNNALFSFRVELTKQANGTYTVTKVAKSGEGGFEFTGDYVILISESCDKWADSATFRESVAVGQVAKFTGDPDSGTATVELYDASKVTVVGGGTEEIAHADKYDANKLPLELAKPVKEGQVFFGWYLEEDFSGKKLTSIEAGTTGDLTLYARFVDEGYVEPTYSKINYVLNDGKFTEEVADVYEEGKEFVLPVPVREGYKFLGWSLTEGGTEYVTSLADSQTGEVTVYANWEEKEVEPTITVGEGGQYAALDDAINASKDGDVIKILAGTYSLSVALTKSLTFVGEGMDKTIINVAKDVPGNVNADTIIFDKVTLQGVGGGAGVSGVYFQSNTNAHIFTVTNSRITAMNTFIKFQAATTNPIVATIENCVIDNIGQFFAWVTKGMDAINFYGNTVDASTCGGIANTAAALLRVRSGSAYVYGNVFNGSVIAIDGLFESGAAANEVVVKYNAFNDCNTIVHINDGKSITFDENLYVVAGSALTAAPATVAGNGVTADTKVLATEEERAALYKAFREQDKNTYKINYVLNGGTLPEGAPTTYVAGTEVVLPTPTKDRYTFLGWTLNEGNEYVTVISASQTGDVTLTAHFTRTTLKVGENEEYKTIAEALAKAVSGDIIEVASGTYADAVDFNVENITVIGPNKDILGRSERNAEAVLTGAVKVSAANVTLNGLKFSEGAGIVVAADYCTISNAYIDATPVTCNGQNRKAPIVDGADISDLTVKDSYINVPGDTYSYATDYMAFNYCANLTVTNNYITNQAVNSGAGCDGLMVYTAKGKYVITNNEFRYATTGWLVQVGFTSADLTDVLFVENIVAGRDDLRTCTVAFRNLGENATVKVYGNEFYNVEPSTFYFKGSHADALIDIQYNYFDEKTSFKLSDTGSATITTNNNAYTGGFHSANLIGANDEVTYKTLEEVKAAYAKYKEDEAKKVYSPIIYVLDGGTLPKRSQTTYVEGVGYTLPTPTKEGFIFLGWSLTEGGTEYVTEISTTQTGGVTLYANWQTENLGDVSFELNGGNCDDLISKYPQGYVTKLPVPTKEGYIFMGWYLNEKFDGEAYFEIPATLTGELKFYALWQIDSTFEVTYVLNGSNSLFKDRADLVNQFVADFNAYFSKKITVDKFFDASYGLQTNQINEFFTTSDYATKWGWLYTYLSDQHSKVEGNETFPSSWVAYERAAIHNFLNKNHSSSYSCDFSSYAVGEGFWDLIQKEVTVKDAKTILEAYYPFHTFLGWYDNAEFAGEPVKTLTANTTLYAKWEMTELTLTYVLNNDEASMTATEVKFDASKTVTLETPTFNSKYWKFEGWYSDPDFVYGIEEIGECQLSNVTVYAKWTEIAGYTITYNLNGGSIIYDSRKSLVEAFIKDYSEVMGKDYKTSEDIPTGAWVDIDFHTFYTKANAAGENMRTKWLWLAEYIYELSVRDLASNNCNVLGLKALINNSGYAGDDTYGLSYAFRAFLAGSIIRPNTSYTSVDFRVYENANGFWNKLSQAEKKEYLNNKGTVVLPEAHLENYKFEGWYDNAEFTGERITEVTDTITLWAKFVEANPVTEIKITNAVTELKRFELYQLTWEVLPAEALIRTVTFESSDPTKATVDASGLINTLGDGEVTITVRSLSASKAVATMTFVVYSPDHFDVSYETESYVTAGETIKLNAKYVKRDGSILTNITWSSLNSDIATVVDGVVTGVKAGLATIRATVADGVYFDFVVTVLDENLSDAIKLIVSANESNVFTRYELGIGAGGPAYYCDIFGSVSKLLFNEKLEILTTYEAAQAANKQNNSGQKDELGTQFITVHYTGNMDATAYASSNANYFATNTSTSIHYVTGSDEGGIYRGYHVLNNDYMAHHAADGTGVAFEWYKTGVLAPVDGSPVKPVWGITSNSTYSINGIDTGIEIPKRDDGIVVTGLTFTLNGKEYNSINKMGLPWKIVDGEYYMGKTHWGTQIEGFALCSYGGNRNSIGIESTVCRGSDLWHVWQKTAQLVAQLMLDYNLDINRVVGHHFYSGKDCPQPLLENDLEIWNKFIGMVEYEYELLTTYKDYEFTMEVLDGSEVCANTGRVAPNGDAKVITYKVTVKHGDTVETITLASAVNGIYSEGVVTHPSLQNKGIVLQ